MFVLKYTTLLEINFNEDFESLSKNEDILFVGALIFKLYKISNINSQQIPGDDPSECKYSHDPVICHSQSCCNRGYGIVPINSLINHNCDPNVKNVVSASQKVINYTLVPIKRGSQVKKLVINQKFFE